MRWVAVKFLPLQTFIYTYPRSVQVLFPLEDNLDLLGYVRRKPLSVEEFIASITSKDIIDSLANKLV